MNILKWKIKDLIEVIEGCVLNNFDVIICAEGKRGTGKSTILFKIASRLGRRGVIKFNPETSIVYSRDETLQLLATKEKWCIFADEMINVTYKRDFYEQQQKQIIKALNMYRDSCNVFMMAVPQFKDLDGDMRQLCKIKISMIRRGIAYIYIQPNFEDILEFTNSKNKSKWKNRNINIKLEPVKRIGLITCTDITDKQKTVYKEIKMRKRGQVFGDDDISVDPMSDWYNKLFKQLTEHSLSKESFNAIIQMAGKKESSVRGRIGQMLRDSKINKTVKDLLKDDDKSLKIVSNEWND